MEQRHAAPNDGQVSYASSYQRNHSTIHLHSSGIVWLHNHKYKLPVHRLDLHVQYLQSKVLRTNTIMYKLFQLPKSIPKLNCHIKFVEFYLEHRCEQTNHRYVRCEPLWTQVYMLPLNYFRSHTTRNQKQFPCRSTEIEIGIERRRGLVWASFWYIRPNFWHLNENLPQVQHVQQPIEFSVIHIRQVHTMNPIPYLATRHVHPWHDHTIRLKSNRWNGKY